jgi:hypothetical protein
VLTRTAPSDKDEADRKKRLESENKNQLAVEKTRKEKEVAEGKERQKVEDKKVADFKESQKRHTCSKTTSSVARAYTEAEARAKLEKITEPAGSSGKNFVGDPYRVISRDISCRREATNINPEYICSAKQAAEVDVVGPCGGSGPSQGISR